MQCRIRHQSLTASGNKKRFTYSFGWGNFGALGHGHYHDINTPKEISSLSSLDIIQISSGWAHSYALTSSGELYRWGWVDDIKTMYSSANLKVNAPGLLNIMQSIGQKLKLLRVLNVFI